MYVTGRIVILGGSVLPGANATGAERIQGDITDFLTEYIKSKYVQISSRNLLNLHSLLLSL